VHSRARLTFSGEPGKIAYLLPTSYFDDAIMRDYLHTFELGIILHYGNCRDHLDPSLNRVLRTFNVYVIRASDELAENTHNAFVRNGVIKVVSVAEINSQISEPFCQPHGISLKGHPDALTGDK
jgi:hypothetical protein